MPSYIRQWRKHRRLTLEQMAERMDMNHGALPRIERGERPYSQDILEKAAAILQCEVIDLLARDPGEQEPLWSIWDRIEPDQRDTARRILEQLAAPEKNAKKA